MVSPLRAFVRLVAYLALTLALMPVQLVALAISTRMAVRLPLFYHRLSCRILGFDIKVVGERSRARPTLFISNHASYIDISVLASLIPGSFIAKAEVSSWPLFGTLAKLQRTVFVERRRDVASAQRDTIRQRLENGDNLILFAEGTSSDGMRVQPFKSALFSAAKLDQDTKSVTIQPVSIAYTRLDGMPLGRGLKPFVAWYGDMSMAPHLLALLGLGKITIEVNFHPAVTFDAFASRKALSLYCQSVVATGLSAANAGRSGLQATAPATQG